MEAVVRRSATLLKKRIWHSCFPVNTAKFLRTSVVATPVGMREGYCTHKCCKTNLPLGVAKT